jgi:hypothetical protein
MHVHAYREALTRFQVLPVAIFCRDDRMEVKGNQVGTYLVFPLPKNPRFRAFRAILRVTAGVNAIEPVSSGCGSLQVISVVNSQCTMKLPCLSGGTTTFHVIVVNQMGLTVEGGIFVSFVVMADVVAVEDVMAVAVCFEV